ncbi:hypothetical protein D9613_009718 [Agrocybe pediades]|uniref:DUF2235 domain-containing protein n=1 Tax=Agrocybe pediades TaxID=84607 RepID=A0A8H4QX56_9AGAR|nr:hypothetical protein D9613_009718 [Agrocybe pediades]
MANVGETEENTAHASKSGPQGTSVCCHGTEGGRNLVVNLDGTGNQFGDKNTNVVEMYSLLSKGEDSNQLSLYYSGIGTYARPSWASFSYWKQVLYHKIDLAIAWEFEKTIMGAYSWLSDNYRDGDRIFLLGFSRGAFQVRALSAMIDKVGLLYKGNNTQIPFAYELYADPLSGLDQVNAIGTSDRDAEKMSKADRFKSAFCHKDVKVHFVGAWDTVSSIGLVRKKKLLPGTIDGMKHVCFFRHALALDERRVKFLPEYAYGGTTLPPEHTDPALPTEDNDYILHPPFLDAFLYAAVRLFSFAWRFDIFSFAYRLVTLYILFCCLRFAQDIVILDKGSLPYIAKFEPKESSTPSWPGTFDTAGENRPLLEAKQGASSTTEKEPGFKVLIGLLEGRNLVISLTGSPMASSIWNSVRLREDDDPDSVWQATQPAQELPKAASEEDDEDPNSIWQAARPVQELPEAASDEDDEDPDSVWEAGPTPQDAKVATPQCLEVWFAGTHSDIGGGNVQNVGMDRSRPPLRWMVHEAGALGLRMKPFTRELSSKEHIEVKESLTGLWKFLEWLPFRRLTFTGENAREWETYRPHHGAGRVIQPGQKIHGSLTLANRLGKSDGYTPKARLSSKLLMLLSEIKNFKKNKDERFWESLGDERFRNWLEVDLEQHVESLLCMYISEREAQKEQVLNALKQIPTWNDGRQALYDVCIKLLCATGYTKLENNTNPKSAGKPLDNNESYQLLKIAKDLLPVWRLRDVNLVRCRDLCGSLATFFDNEAQKKDAATFLLRFTRRSFVDSVLQTTSPPRSITFSTDGKWLVSGHLNGTVCIWGLKNSSWQTGSEALGQHSSTVTSVKFSPDDKHVVSGSYDKTIRFWDIEKMEQVGDSLKGHADDVNCVAFSPDGTKVLSASDDNTVRFWDPKTGKEMAVQGGHERSVLSLAISHEGKYIVSGSYDGAVRIREAQTYQQDGEPLKGHTKAVWSVAYSSDSKRIASGSLDHTIRIWDAEARVQVGEPLQGHSDYVNSVCFSPDGKLLASGSDDCTIRIWDANTGMQIGVGLRGHSDCVWSVAFSPDGKQLASASEDHTIRIWDIESYRELYSLSIRLPLAPAYFS